MRAAVKVQTTTLPKEEMAKKALTVSFAWLLESNILVKNSSATLLLICVSAGTTSICSRCSVSFRVQFLWCIKVWGTCKANVDCKVEHGYHAHTPPHCLWEILSRVLYFSQNLRSIVSDGTGRTVQSKVIRSSVGQSQRMQRLQVMSVCRRS